MCPSMCPSCVQNTGFCLVEHLVTAVVLSVLQVIAYLMKEFKWSLEEAHDFTKSKRSIINPNTGFWKQLVTYEGILKAR